jgi:LytS/YehU family sensor histidine kinase
LLLLPVVENAFKYVGGDYRLKINVTKEEKDIVLRVENAVSPPLVSNANAGIGLENLRRRLELLYPGNHQLKTLRDGSVFKAELILGEIYE